MKIALVPNNEQESLKAQREHYVLDILPDADFDDITRIASQICNTPASLVSIIDANRQWVKSVNGLGVSEVPMDLLFSIWAAETPGEVFVVPDLSKDKLFCDHQHAGGKKRTAFYAGIPLVAPDGALLGTLCILDKVPRALDDQQIIALQALARQVVTLLELRGIAGELDKKRAELKMAYEDLAKIARVASHDLKSPLNNIISLTHLLKEDYGTQFDPEGAEYVNYLNDAAYQLSDLVSGILSYSRTSQVSVEQKENINVASLIEEVIGLLSMPANTAIEYPKGEINIHTSCVALKQILMHLLHNAVKYNDSDPIKVDVAFRENEAAYVFEVKDNGPGIAEEDKDKIFELFEKLRGSKDGESMGIGLAVVKRFVEKLGGTVLVNSGVSTGSSFTLTIPK